MPQPTEQWSPVHPTSLFYQQKHQRNGWWLVAVTVAENTEDCMGMDEPTHSIFTVTGRKSASTKKEMMSRAMGSLSAKPSSPRGSSSRCSRSSSSGSHSSRNNCSRTVSRQHDNNQQRNLQAWCLPCVDDLILGVVSAWHHLGSWWLHISLPYSQWLFEIAEAAKKMREDCRGLTPAKDMVCAVTL